MVTLIIDFGGLIMVGWVIALIWSLTNVRK